MRVGVLGINHRLAGLKLREQLAKSCLQRLDPGHSLQHGEHRFVLLSTCNRTEIYFSSAELANTHSYILNILRKDIEEEFDQKLYTFFGKDCLVHLCRVAAGLDSAILAETEIQGQVKIAYEKAHAFQKLPHELHYLFQKSLAIAKRARTLLPLKPGLPDIEHAVLQAGEQLFGELQQIAILFVGASVINDKIISHLKARQLKNITLCNRTRSKGEAMAKSHGVTYLKWEQFTCWPSYDWIILGTSSPDYLIHASTPLSLASKKLLVDLSVPRNVDPLVKHHKQLVLLNIDQINCQLQVRKNKMTLSLELAEELIMHAAHQQSRLFLEKDQFRICAAIA